MSTAPKYLGPFAKLADLASKSRMRALVEETKLAQAQADHAELGGFLERVVWMHARALVMQERNVKAAGMVAALVSVERAIQEALRSIEGKS